jgi:RNA polymerase sigma-70 factor (ECF subfamily)
VLGFSAAEVAETLETTVASVNSALQRARATVEERLPERSQQATLRSLGDAELRAIVDRYIAAWEQGDVDGVVALLAEDVILTMPPLETWYAGRKDVGAFLANFPLSGAWRWRWLPARVNGQAAAACYAWDPVRACTCPSRSRS